MLLLGLGIAVVGTGLLVPQLILAGAALSFYSLGREQERKENP